MSGLIPELASFEAAAASIKPSPWNWNPSFLSSDARQFVDSATSLVPFWSDVGVPYDLIRNEFLTGSGSPDWIANEEGVAGDCPTVNDYWTLATVGELFPILTQGTILMVRRKATGSNPDASAFGYRATDRLQSHCPWSDGTVYFDWFDTTNGRVSKASLTFGGMESYVFSAGPTGHRMTRNGILEASNTNTASSISSISSGSFRINSNSVNTGNIQEFNLFATFDAELTAAEAEWLSLNWKELLRPDLIASLPAYLAPAAGAAASIMNQLQGSNLGSDLYDGTLQ